MTATPLSSEPITIHITTDAALIHRLAHETWYHTYRSILALEQIEYMLAEIYSLDSLQKQMRGGQTFLLLQVNHQPAAFASYTILDKSQYLYKLNKIYVHPSFQKKSLGKILLQEVTEQVKDQGGKKLELNVHRDNPAQYFYFKFGFELLKIINIPFGRFMLNDYILTLKLS